VKPFIPSAVHVSPAASGHLFLNAIVENFLVNQVSSVPVVRPECTGE
jgi:hypothetical protein